MSTATTQTLLSDVAARAREAGVFAEVTLRAAMLECTAKDSGAPAFYRVFAADGRVWVALVTADRWLSQSIEQDLVHTGDKLTDLLEEELIDLGYLSWSSSAKLPVEHFRDEAKLFTFRSPVPTVGPTPEADAARVGMCLLGYEACFRRLGDMEAGDED